MRRITACVLCIFVLLSGCPFTAFALDDGSAAAYAYPQADVLQLDLYMQPSHYLRLTHSQERKKHPAVVSIDDGPLREIGVRVRGAMSLEDGMNFASKRIPMELIFDYSDPNGKFRDNASLKLINCYTPARLLTQLIAMQTFLYLGIPSPRIQPAFLRINGVDFGLYLAIEDLNKDFVRNRFGTGSLYRRFNMRESANGEEDAADDGITFENVKMKVKVNDGTQTIRSYEQALSRGGSIEPYVDADAFLRFLACEMFVSDKDGIQYLKNCYFLEHDGKLSPLPWDQSAAFDVFEEDNRDDEPYTYHENKFVTNTALYAQLLQNDAYYARYRQYLRQLNDGFLDPDAFLPWLESYIRTLSPYLQRDASIGLHTEHIAEDLTTGSNLYNDLSGNLLLTFRVYHDETQEILSGKKAWYYVPEGMSAVSEDPDTQEEEERIFGSDHSIIFRICNNYWNMRRQAYLQTYGSAVLAAGIAFAAVFLLTVLSVKRPKGKKPRGSPRAKEGGT